MTIRKTHRRGSETKKSNLRLTLLSTYRDIEITKFNYKKNTIMNLFDTISEDIKKAMLAKDKVALEALRGIKKEFLEAKTAPGANNELSDDTALKIMQKMVKQRKESADIFAGAGRQELADAELAQVAVIQRYLPQQMSEQELEKVLKDMFVELDIKGPQDMGKIMGQATKRLAGKAEGRAISAKVKELLNQL